MPSQTKNNTLTILLILAALLLAAPYLGIFSTRQDTPQQRLQSEPERFQRRSRIISNTANKNRKPSSSVPEPQQNNHSNLTDLEELLK